MWALATGVSIAYILRYARKVQLNPKRSLAPGHNHVPAAEPDAVKSKRDLTPKMRLLLAVFALTFAVMIFGVSRLDWWFAEMTTLFFAAALLVGINPPPRRKGFHRNVHRRGTKSSRRWIDYRHRARRDADFG
jgi:uncharacterized ion transporter superfamily protein YfcC